MLRGLWRRIVEPRHLAVIYAGIHLITLLTGLVTLAVPPQTISGALGSVMTVVWSACFILGGGLGAIAALPGWWKWERWSCAFTLAGIVIYGAVLAGLHLSAGSGSRLTQIGVLLLAAGTFVVRLVSIWGRSYGPRV